MSLIKTQKEIEIMREGGKVLSGILKKVTQAVRPGVSTWELDKLARDLIKEAGGEPSFLGYNNYPCALCTSINDAVVHGLPKKEEIIQNGNIIGLDLGLKYQGYYTDMAVTIAVGKPSKVGRKLIKVARRALDVGMGQVKLGNHVGDIGAAIQRYVESLGFSVVRDLVGHGVGRDVHEPPRIPNFGEPGSGEELQVRMTLALEPMICEKGHQVKTAGDKWTVVTVDGGLAAHFEQTVVVTEKGCEILTR